jgi:hypothetical protein
MAETSGEDSEVDTNISVEALVTDAATAPEVSMLGGRLILG